MAKQNFPKRMTAFLASPKFFWGVLAFFVFEAAWIALSGLYPMAFDEDYHLGIIHIYANHISPFWSAQPAGTDAFGAVFRDPSYLYQWLMSFPYRFIRLFTDNQTALVLWLRAINIGLFAAGLVLYRRLLRKTGASKAIVNLVLLLFVLIPVVPLLAAQINYDNLFLPLTGLILLLAAGFNERLGRKQLDLALLSGILALCLLASLVKYAFLPIFIAVALYLVIRTCQAFESPRSIWKAMLEAIKKLGRLGGLLAVGAFIVSSGLFIERYGGNLARYHTPVPSCDQALSVQECTAYGPWRRDYKLALHKNPHAESSPLVFAADWFYGMWLRLFFSVDGPTTRFQTRGPLLLPSVSAIVFSVSGLVVSLAYAKRLFRKYRGAVLGLLLLVSGVYVSALWLDGYETFLRTGVAVAINGRYLLPVLPFLMLVSALAFNELCRNRQNLKVLIGGLAVLCMLWGGGTLTYILRSNPRWYWHNPAVKAANEDVRNALAPLTPGYRHPTAFMR